VTREESDRVTALLEELVTWTRLMARGHVEQTLQVMLKERKHRAVYELTDGERTQTQIAAMVGIDQSTVSDLWSRWRRMGLLQETPKRPKQLIRLSDLGWDSSLPSSTAGRRSRKA
jgi:hypothetical protein